MSVELVLAPGVLDSASSLSYPYTKELINSVIKAWVYAYAGYEDIESFSAFGRYGVFDVDVDFRKRLHIITHLNSRTGSLPRQHRIWGCRYRVTSYARTEIALISLADFNVDGFKLVSFLPCELPQLIVIFLDGQEAQGSQPYSTAPLQLDFPTQIEVLPHQTPETVRVSTLSRGT